MGRGMLWSELKIEDRDYMQPRWERESCNAPRIQRSLGDAVVGIENMRPWLHVTYDIMWP